MLADPPANAADGPPDGAVNVDDLLFKQDWFLRQGTSQQVVDLLRAIDPQFVEYALAQLGKYVG